MGMLDGTMAKGSNADDMGDMQDRYNELNMQLQDGSITDAGREELNAIQQRMTSDSGQ